MDIKDEQRECDDVTRWAEGRPAAEVAARLQLLLETNSWAREMFNMQKPGCGIQQGLPDGPILGNHTGYNRLGSENWEHDDTGDRMNYSGAADNMLNPMSEHNDWESGYDYDERHDDSNSL